MNKTYDDFIKQVDLIDIHLISVEYKKIENPDPDWYPQIEVNFKPKKATYCQGEDCFEVEQEVQFTLSECDSKKEAKSRKLFELKAVFAITYMSNAVMNDEMFELFRKRNIPVNIHPYARELIQNAMLRVGLPPFTLPALKIKK